MSVTLPDPGRMEGRTVVLTGSSSGIGRAAARELAALGAQVVIVGRDPDRTRAIAEELDAPSHLADFTSLASVRVLASELLEAYPRIHVLANNAGGLAEKRRTTPDGYETMFQQNHLSGFLLTHLLLPRLRETAADVEPGSVRIIQTSSAANLHPGIRMDDLDTLHGPWVRGYRAYGRSKLANILHTRELARRLRGTGIDTFAFHPGLVSTNFGGHSTAWQLMTSRTGMATPAEAGAQPLVRLVAAPTVPAPSGNYFHRLKAPGPVHRQADDPGLAKALWSASEVRAGIRG
jgi:NAD(P)-dependent dehydrogenase (short-subunit alcohol dehydrogenase family)